MTPILLTLLPAFVTFAIASFQKPAADPCLDARAMPCEG
jgi:hypothetical protein